MPKFIDMSVRAWPCRDSCSNAGLVAVLVAAMLPPVNSSMATLVAWSRALVGAQRREILRLLETSPARGLTLFRMVSCRAGWRRFWTWPKNSARVRFSAAPRACDAFKIVFVMYRGESRYIAAYHQSSFPGAGQRNCLRAVAWVAPGILNRASTPSTAGTVLEAATWQRRWRLWAVHVLVLCFSLSACIFP